MTIQAGFKGQQPAVLISPIVRTPMTVGELRKALEDLPDHVSVVVNGDGVLNKVHKKNADEKTNEPWVLLMHIGDGK